MISLLWKEYREHRSIWLTMVISTSLLALVLVQFTSGGDASSTRVGLVSIPLMVLGMAAAYGVVCGAMMFAGEREAGTMVFLDIFSGKRDLLWLCKFAIGILLAATEALVIALIVQQLLKQPPPPWLPTLVGQKSGEAFISGTGTADPSYWFAVLPLVTLEAYGWGLLGSSFTRRVLSGAAVAALMAAPVWLIAVFTPPPVSLGIRLVTAGIAIVLSNGIFLMQSRDVPLGPAPKRREKPHPMRRFAERWEREKFNLESRAPQLARPEQPAVEVVVPVVEERLRQPVARRRRRPQASSPGQVLWWLTFEQAKLVLLILAGAAVLVGLFMPAHGQVLWPVATLLLGVACGTAAFAQEQRDASYQFLAAQHLPLYAVWNIKMVFWFLAAVLLTLLIAVSLPLAMLVERLGTRPAAALHAGFNFGSLLDLLGPVLFFGVWLVYGFCIGHVFVLFCRKAALAVLLSTLVGAAAIGLWLPSLLCLGMGGWQVWVPCLVILAGGRYLMRAWAGGRIKERKPLAATIAFALAAMAWAALILGWRAWEIPKVDEPLDRAAFRASLPSGKDNAAALKIQEALAKFEDPDAKEDWLRPLAEAARLPLGVMETPRSESTLTHLTACRKMTDQLRRLCETAVKQRTPAAAVEHLTQMLALSRNLRNKAPLLSYWAGVETEKTAVEFIDWWLAHDRPAPDLLRRVLDELNRHAAETPSALDCLETECFRAGLVLANPVSWKFARSQGGLGRIPEPALVGPIAFSLEMPWENERKTRLWRIVWDGLFRNLRTPHWQLPEIPLERPGNPSTQEILRGWLPVGEGPGSSMTLAKLARLLDNSWLGDERLFAPVMPLRGVATRSRWRVDAARLTVALGLYQFQHGKTATRLEDLVPKYLPDVPVDPYSGEPVRYRISNGERIEFRALDEPRRPKPAVQGQGILWSTGPDRSDHGGRQDAGSLPDDNVQWSHSDFDLVTLVPHWPRQ